MRASDRRGLLALSVALAATGCRVDPLAGAGRPCGVNEPCGPGTTCVAGRCLAFSADGSGGERPLLGDGPHGERGDLTLRDGDAAGVPDARSDRSDLVAKPDLKADLKKPPLDQQPPDQKKLVDLSLPDLSGCGVCPLGCNAALNRCKRLLPSGFAPQAFFETVSADLNPANGSTLVFNTATGSVSVGSQTLRPAGNPGSVVGGIYWGTVTQGNGYPELAVFASQSLALPSASSLEIVGDRAFALYLTGSGSTTIAGTIRALPSGPSPGAGGFAGGPKTGSPAATCFGGEGKPGTNSGGGGGGGRAATGGAGGMTGGAGGMINGGLALVPLYGGCGGGPGGANPSPPYGEGGGGGGAIQLSGNGPIQISGTITVPGAGGRHGGEGAGGGGSGGAILLEAPAVSVAGLLAANGGGGGGGDTDGDDGADGKPALTSAPGGNGGTSGGDGGKGGVRGSEAGAPGGNVQDGGGGGGGVGRIRINALSISLGASNATPAPSQSNTVQSF